MANGYKVQRNCGNGDLVVGRLVGGLAVGGLGLDVAGVNLGGWVLGRHRRRQDVAGRLVAVLVGDKGDLDLLAIAVGVAPGALLAVEVLRLAVGVLAVAGYGHASLRPGQKGKRARNVFEVLVQFVRNDKDINDRAQIFYCLWGIFCATFGKKIGQVRSGHEVMTS